MLEKSMNCHVLITVDSASSKTIEISHREPRLQAVGELDASAETFMEEWQLWEEDEHEETCRETNGEMLEERDGGRNCWRCIPGRRRSIPKWPKSDPHRGKDDAEGLRTTGDLRQSRDSPRDCWSMGSTHQNRYTEKHGRAEENNKNKNKSVKGSEDQQTKTFTHMTPTSTGQALTFQHQKNWNWLSINLKNKGSSD